MPVQWHEGTLRRFREIEELIAERDPDGTQQALDTKLHILLEEDDPIPPRCNKADIYENTFTPERAKHESEKRITGPTIEQNVLDASIMGPKIKCAITWMPLGRNSDRAHSMAFGAKPNTVGTWDRVKGDPPETSHVDARDNMLFLNPFEHRKDTRHTLLRFPICFDDDGSPTLAPRIESLMEWNIAHPPSERRRAVDEFPPRTGKDSIGWLYWALEASTDVDFNVLHNRAGTDVYLAPVSEGIFYRSHDDPFAAISATAGNLKELNDSSNGLKIGHLCIPGQNIIRYFNTEYVSLLTSGGLAESPMEFYSQIPPSPATRAKIQAIPIAPPPSYVESPSTTSEAQSEIISFGAQSWREGSSETDNDNNPPSSPCPNPRPHNTRSVTLPSRTIAAVMQPAFEKKVREQEEHARQERMHREEHERTLANEERKRQREESEVQKEIVLLAEEAEAHRLYALAHHPDRKTRYLDLVEFDMIREARSDKHAMASVFEKGDHGYPTRALVKARKAKLGILEGEPTHEQCRDSWAKNCRFPDLPPIPELTVINSTGPCRRADDTQDVLPTRILGQPVADRSESTTTVASDVLPTITADSTPTDQYDATVPTGSSTSTLAADSTPDATAQSTSSRDRKGKGKEVARDDASNTHPAPGPVPYEMPVVGLSRAKKVTFAIDDGDKEDSQTLVNINFKFIGNGDRTIGANPPTDAPQTSVAGPSRRSARQPRVGTRRSPRDHSRTSNQPVEQVDGEDYATQKGKKRAPAHSNARAPMKKKKKT